MKVIYKVLLCLGLMASQAQANVAEQQSEQILETIATAMVLQDIEDGLIVLEDESGLFDQIKQFIDETKTFILETYDFNGNGRIDFGDELDGVVEFGQSILLTLVDRDYDGVIEPEEVQAIVQELLATARQQINALACDQITAAAERAGAWLRFRPILKGLFQRCQAQGL